MRSSLDSSKAYLILSPLQSPKLPASACPFYQAYVCCSDSHIAAKGLLSLFILHVNPFYSFNFYNFSYQRDTAQIMAAMLGAAGGGDLGALPLEQWFFEMPVCTRWWTTATVVTGLLVQCHILTPFQLFYSFRAVFVRSQVCLSSSAISPSY
jgi:hypothetical protein